MKQAFRWIGVILLTAAPLGLAGCPRPEAPAGAPEAPAEKTVSDVWDAVYLEGAKAGSFHTVVREVERDGRKLLAATQTMQLNVKREGSVVELRVETGTEETPDGKVVAVSQTTFTGKGKVTQTGRVEDGRLVIRSSPGDEVVKAPWDDGVLGQARQEDLFRDRKVKPGDHFSYTSYELSLQAVTTLRVEVKGYEEVDMLEENKGKVTRVKRSLLRTEATPDKVMVGGRPMQLPGMTAWLDDDRAVVRSELELPGLGRFTLYRTSKAVAEQAGAATERLPDLLTTTLVPLDKSIDHSRTAKEIVYRVVLKGDDDPAAAFTHDDRQEAKNLKDGACELRVRAVREPAPGEKDNGAGDEFLKSTYFLDADNPNVKGLARKAVGDESDAWRKALRVEKWVHDHMTVSTGVNYVPASQTATDLRGDCRQHGMLAAAMCRAAGLPARTALGLVYTEDEKKGPVLAFHMWTEVWVKGQWMGLDATLGEGGVGADHIKLADHAWGDTQPMAPLLAVTRVMGRMSAEVVSVK
jgi:hypothetical protein